MGRPCSACHHVSRPSIDGGLLDPRTTLESLEKAYGITRKSLARHRDVCLGAKLSVAAKIHARVSTMAAVSETHDELSSIYGTLREDWASARQREDWNVAVKTVRELTRLYELQARLTLEAAAGRAQDVSQHPVFLEFMAGLVTELSAYPEALARLHALVRKRLGKESALTVPGGTPLPPSG